MTFLTFKDHRSNKLHCYMRMSAKVCLKYAPLAI